MGMEILGSEDIGMASTPGALQDGGSFSRRQLA